jgi:hypothetical protein
MLQHTAMNALMAIPFLMWFALVRWVQSDKGDELLIVMGIAASYGVWEALSHPHIMRSTRPPMLHHMATAIPLFCGLGGWR